MQASKNLEMAGIKLVCRQFTFDRFDSASGFLEDKVDFVMLLIAPRLHVAALEPGVDLVQHVMFPEHPLILGPKRFPSFP